MAIDFAKLKSRNLLRASEDHAYCYNWLLRMVDAKEGAPRFKSCCDLHATRVGSLAVVVIALLVGICIGKL